jgi:hypothetical protein
MLNNFFPALNEEHHAAAQGISPEELQALHLAMTNQQQSDAENM